MCRLVPGLSLLATACGGLGAGDYVVYRIAATEGSLGSDCNADDDDSSTLRDTVSAVLYVAGGEEDQPLLDFGGDVLTGSETDDGYTFSGSTVDREPFGGQTIFDSDHDGVDDVDDPMVDSDADGEEDFTDADVDVDMDGLHDLLEDDIVDLDGDGEDDRIVTSGESVLITTLALDVSLTIDGETVSGTAKIKTSVACDGPCDGFDASSCTVTQDFVGVQIDDALLDLPN